MPLGNVLDFNIHMFCLKLLKTSIYLNYGLGSKCFIKTYWSIICCFKCMISYLCNGQIKWQSQETQTPQYLTKTIKSIPLDELRTVYCVVWTSLSSVKCGVIFIKNFYWPVHLDLKWAILNVIVCLGMIIKTYTAYKKLKCYSFA